MLATSVIRFISAISIATEIIEFISALIKLAITGLILVVLIAFNLVADLIKWYCSSRITIDSWDTESIELIALQDKNGSPLRGAALKARLGRLAREKVAIAI